MSLVATAVVGAYSADRAADAQVDASNAASGVQMQMFNQSRQDQMPWLQAGQGGLNALMGLYGMQSNGSGGWSRSADPMAMARQYMQQDPSYQFRFGEGQRAIENSALARGNFQSGNTLRAMSDYGQNMASTEFQNIANRLAGLAGTGQSTAQNFGALGANTANAVGSNMLNAGQARASGYMGRYAAMNNMVNQGTQLIGTAMGAGGGGM